MRKAIVVVGLWVGAVLASGCGGEGALGEECGEEGIQDGECEDGAVCGKPDDGDALACLKVCDEQADCSDDQECNGVSGSDVKGCRPKDQQVR